MMAEQGQATELQIWMDKLREAVKREKAEPEQEGDGEDA